jgi:hypothetical protein
VGLLRLLVAITMVGCASSQPAPPPPLGPVPIPQLEDYETTEEKVAALRSFLAQATARGVAMDGGGSGAPVQIVAPAAIQGGVEAGSVDPSGGFRPLRWMDPNDGDALRITFEGQPQHYSWMTWLYSQPLESSEEDQLAGIMTSELWWEWEGCTQIQATFSRPPEPVGDGTYQVISSFVSNAVVVGACLDPPPEPVPEPRLGLGLVAGLVVLGTMDRRRRSRRGGQR